MVKVLDAFLLYREMWGKKMGDNGKSKTPQLFSLSPPLMRQGACDCQLWNDMKTHRDSNLFAYFRSNSVTQHAGNRKQVCDYKRSDCL